MIITQYLLCHCLRKHHQKIPRDSASVKLIITYGCDCLKVSCCFIFRRRINATIRWPKGLQEIGKQDSISKTIISPNQGKCACLNCTMAFHSYPYNGFTPGYEQYTTPYGGPSSYLETPMSPPPSPYSSRSSSSASGTHRREESNAYFLPGHGISKSVIFDSYQRLLGPTATIRPFSYQQREGYMLTHTGSPLTKVGLCSL